MKSTGLNYLVIEYVPVLMDGEKETPARIDGHYRFRQDAMAVASWWAENPKHPESRIVVVEVRDVVKNPKQWGEHDAA